MKVDKKYSPVLLGLFMSIAMSFTISWVMTIIHNGLVHNLFRLWFVDFLIGFAVALPTSLAVIPIVKRIVNKLTMD